MIERWDPTKHLSLLEGWLEARGQLKAKGALDLYPRVGFLVDESLFAFLFQTDAPGVAYFDCAVGKPGRTAEQVRASAAKAATALSDEAQRLGVRLVVAFTSHPNLTAGCHDAGFASHAEGLAFLAKPLITKETK